MTDIQARPARAIPADHAETLDPDGHGDLLQQLAAEHWEMRMLFSAVLGTPLGDPERSTLMDRITTRLVRHGVVEEGVLYPMVRRLPEDADSELSRRGLEDHARCEASLHQIGLRKATDPDFDHLVAVLHEHVTGHQNWEEARLFPLLREAFGQGELDAAGDRARELRRRARTTAQAPPGVQPPEDHFPPPEQGLRQRLHDRFTPAGGWGALRPH
ncbi:hemerythrin domain-containing protein [Streptacidiphilus sp. MAP12-33]|uniref:hemerythrin domain-containing protein n=1 Tax=Streptacidiphilus sp. MAP12-33 TaxID=3156266 RepID=UPI003513CA83